MRKKFDSRLWRRTKRLWGNDVENREKKFRMPIRKKMFWAIYSLILLLTFIIDSLVFVTYRHDMESKITLFGNQTVQELAVNISRNIRNKEENLAYKLWESKLLKEKKKEGSYQENSKEMKELIALVGNSGFLVRSCYLKRNNESEEFWSDGNISIEEFRDSKIANKIENECGDLNRGTVMWRYLGDDPESVYIIKNIVDSDTLEKEAVLCIQIHKDFFRSLQNSSNSLMILYDEKGNLLYYSDELESVIGEILKGNDSGFITMDAQITKKNWHITTLISKEQALNTLYHLLLVLLAIEFVFCVISFWIAKYVSENMTSNITALISSMKQLEHGEKADIVQAKASDETAYLVEVYNHMNQKLQETIELLIENRTQKERAEYNALIAQMNPHFLYNSLESVSAMAKLSHQTEIVKAVDSLAKLMRVCLSGTDSQIVLKEEFDYIRQYLFLEKLITGGHIEWDIDCEEEMECCLVPKLILQPLVENSIVHGFNGCMEDAMIVISVRTSQRKLLVDVSDNGRGMSQEYADEILAGNEVKKYEQDRRHIGIQSIQQRIRYLYGAEYDMQIKTQENMGTTVRLVMPIIRG